MKSTLTTFLELNAEMFVFIVNSKELLLSHDTLRGMYGFLIGLGLKDQIPRACNVVYLSFEK